MRRLLHLLADWARLRTSRCPVCGALTEDALCAKCGESLAPRTGGYCSGCGEIMGDDETPVSLCGECRTAPPPWDRLHFHSIYAGTLRDLILGYKFNNGLGRASLLAEMACAAHERNGGRTPDVIIPVPLHRKRLLWRGYNQSTELCRALGRKLNRPVPSDALVRIRHTKPQTTLGMVERRENIRAAFKADPALVKGKTVLLVDDVYTTGATLRECARTLRRAGADGLEVLVLARALG